MLLPWALLTGGQQQAGAVVACDACLDVSCSAPTGTPSPPEVFQLFAYCTWSPDGREAPEGFAEIKDNRIWLRDLGWTGWGCMPAFTAPCGGKGGGGCLYQASPLHDFGNGQLYSKPAARPSPGKLSRDGHPLHRQLLLPWRQATIIFVLHVPKASTQFCGQQHGRHCSPAGAQQEPGSSLIPHIHGERSCDQASSTLCISIFHQ